MKLSAVVLTWNEEKYIGRCLESLEGVIDDIVVVDSFSDDATRTIASIYTDSVVTRQYTNTRDQRNFGLSLCENDWRFILDADEYLSPKLKRMLSNKENLDFGEADSIKIDRVNFVDDKPLGIELLTHIVKRGIKHAGHPLHSDRSANSLKPLEWLSPVVSIEGNSHVEHRKTGLEWMQAARMYYWMCPETFSGAGCPPGSEDLKAIVRPFKHIRNNIDVWNEYIKTPQYKKLTMEDISDLGIDSRGWFRKSDGGGMNR